MNSQLKEIENFAHENFVPIIRPKSAEILVNLIKEYNPNQILEIGTAIGYSGILMLKNSKNSKLVTIEKDENRFLMATSNFKRCGLDGRLKQILGDANEEVKRLEQNFDFIFLDGPKTHYLKQLPYLLNHLNVGGLLIADNVLFMGQVLSDAYPKHKHRTAILSLRKFLQTIKSCPFLQTEIIDVEDGLVIAKKIK